MNKAVFLDRDGTINADKNYLYRIEDFEFLPGVISGLQLLQKNGFVLIIVTNQSGIGRGYYTEEDFQKLNDWMINSLLKYSIKIDGVYFCPHLNNATVEKYRVRCMCRKPEIGMFKKAVKDFNLNLSECYAIGDKLRDCCLCFQSECKGFLIEHGESQDIIDKVSSGDYINIKYAESLYDASLAICSKI